MRIGRIDLFLVVVALTFVLLPTRSPAQYQPPSEKLLITADQASTWSDGDTTIVQIDGPVTIQTDQTVMSARQAVVWLTPVRESVLEQQQAEVALIGDAKLSDAQNQLVRTGDRLFVTSTVRGSVRITAERRIAQNQADSDLYRVANGMRPLGGATTDGGVLLQRPWVNAPAATAPSAATTRPMPKEPVSFRAASVERIQTADDKVAIVLAGGVILYQSRANGDLIELQADRAVLFTQLQSLKEIGQTKSIGSIEEAVEAAYLEGDVRIALTPAARGDPEQRLQAERVYYEFTTDRAVLTQAVVHTLEPQRQIPITVRAEIIRQLSVGEYRAEHVELSTSQFQTPTYSVRASRAYVRQIDTGDPRRGNQTSFVADNTTFTLFGAPVFWLPKAGGTFTDRGSALRSINIESGSRFGFGARSEWGLFESAGVLPPRDLDISYRLDYFEKRGPAIGSTAEYQGGYITETTKDAWDFKGRLTGYLVNDHGDDKLGSDRRTVEPPDSIRGRILWEHQHFFPGDWQVQLRGGYASDPTFLEEWFQREFNTGQPHELSAYVKRQRDSEALTLLVQLPTNDFPTTANELQEQAQIERYPELGYRRIGDSFGEDRFTFSSANRVGLLHFKDPGVTLAEEGFRPGQSPGIPSYAYTGTNDSTNFRADFRQEIDYPFSFGQFKLVPYVMARHAWYGDTPDNGSRDRIFLGTGMRINTAFWRVDDSAQSDLFDIHRLRHVLEPELNLFTSGQTKDQTDLFIYDEPVDAINDVTAVQLALHQRWQTKRGGAGQFRSVDFFSLNVEGNFFFNQPADSILNPTGFRGLFFPSLPETSIPRNSINSDALWRVSDTTAVLADEQYNIDENQLATTSIGMAVQRDPRVSYFVGARYIGQINSTIASLASSYELSTKYSLAFRQSFNLTDRQNQDSSVTVIRHFDRLFLTLTAYYDAVDDTSGFSFGLTPEGLGLGIDSGAAEQIFGGR